MTNGERILTVPRANPVDAYTMAGIVKDAGPTIENSRNFYDAAHTTIVSFLETCLLDDIRKPLEDMLKYRAFSFSLKPTSSM